MERRTAVYLAAHCRHDGYPAVIMMKALVIPDVHLKPWIFQRASELMQAIEVNKAVCLMDIADDFGQQFNIDLYIQTYDAAIRFAKKNPDTLWCYGNHDLCYLWNQRETGHSIMAASTVCKKLKELKGILHDERQIAYIHRIDNVIFSHGGLSDYFVREYIPSRKYDDIDSVAKTINALGCMEMWTNESPIWHRPQYGSGKMYKPRKLLQVVGHTPMREITRNRNLISCDVFSTNPDGRPYGTQEFLYLDTETWEYTGVK